MPSFFTAIHRLPPIAPIFERLNMARISVLKNPYLLRMWALWILELPLPHLCIISALFGNQWRDFINKHIPSFILVHGKLSFSTFLIAFRTGDFKRIYFLTVEFFHNLFIHEKTNTFFFKINYIFFTIFFILKLLTNLYIPKLPFFFSFEK